MNSKFLLSILLTGIAFNAYSTIHVFTVQNFQFSPASNNAMTGDTIRWDWISGSHTTTSGTIPVGANSWSQALNSGSTSFEYIPTVAGTYNFFCIPHQSMGMTGSFTVTGNAGVADINPSAFIRVNGNPVRNSLRLTTREISSGYGHFMISDMNGRKFFDFGEVYIPRNSDLVFDISFIPSGIYQLELFVNHQRILTRFMKE